VTPINIATNTAGPRIGAVGGRARSITITPDGETAYVVNERSETVTPVRTATRKVEKAIKVGLVPSGIVITPDGQTAYVANLNSVTPIHLASGQSATKITIKGFPPIIVALALN
jgi:YVTN family beta-propeller protein